MQSNTKDKPLIFESANGITYARYRDDPSIPRWVVGGNTRGYIPGTNIQNPEEWNQYERIKPDFDLILKNKKLFNAYTKFLQEQQKYEVWEKLSE